MELPPVNSECCARCKKCLNNEVPIICEMCNNKICNDCRSIDTRKRTIIATSLTKTGGGKQQPVRLLNMLGSKLSVLHAFRSGLSKSSFEFDEQEEEDQRFDKYFNKPYSDKYHHQQQDHQLDANRTRTNKHNKIEKQLSFQYASERRRRLSIRLNEGGSLDIDNNSNSKASSSLLTVPTIDRQKQSHSDSQLNRTNSIELQHKSKIKTNSFDQMNNDLNNNNSGIVCSNSKLTQLNRMVSLDATSTKKQSKSPVHTPLERSNTVDNCENASIEQRRFKYDNLKTNDFIISICVICAKQM